MRPYEEEESFTIGTADIEIEEIGKRSSFNWSNEKPMHQDYASQVDSQKSCATISSKKDKTMGKYTYIKGA